MAVTEINLKKMIFFIVTYLIFSLLNYTVVRDVLDVMVVFGSKSLVIALAVPRVLLREEIVPFILGFPLFILFIILRRFFSYSQMFYGLIAIFSIYLIFFILIVNPSESSLAMLPFLEDTSDVKWFHHLAFHWPYALFIAIHILWRPIIWVLLYAEIIRCIFGGLRDLWRKAKLKKSLF